MYMRFFSRPLAPPLHLKPFGPPESLPIEYAGTFGKNARTSTLAWLHGIPHAVTWYLLPRRGGAFGAWMPHSVQAGPVIVHRVCDPFGISGIDDAGGRGGGAAGGEANATPASTPNARKTIESTIDVRRAATAHQTLRRTSGDVQRDRAVE